MPACECQFISQDMPFMRLSWLLSEKCDLFNLPPNDEIPHEALIFPPEMKYAYFVSHRWRDHHHPDVSGLQLALALSSIWSDVDSPWADPFDCDHSNRTGVWYDYLCLPQAPGAKADKHKFYELLLQIPPLTLTAVPILVVEEGLEYASRAWCALETLGAQNSGHHFYSLSMAMQTIRYEKILCEQASAWDLSLEVQDGCRAGLSKLKQWADRNGFTFETDPLHREAALKRHMNCMRKLMEATLLLKYNLDHLSYIDEQVLIEIANKSNLHCTYAGDLTICMHLMCQLFRPGLFKERNLESAISRFIEH